MDAVSSPACSLLQGSGSGVFPTSIRHHEPLLLCTPTSSAPTGYLTIGRPRPRLPSKPRPANLPTAAALPTATHRSGRAITRPSKSPAHTAAAPVVVSHTRASTGYALALLDAARCGGAVEAVRRDALRILWEGADGVAGTLQEGGLHWQTAALVRMLLRKDKGELVGEVMREVRRLCDELVIDRTSAGKLGRIYM